MPKKQKPNHKLNDYANYSSIVIQMAVIIFLGTFSGLKIDKYTNIDFPIFTLLLSTFSIVLAVYLAIKDVIDHNT